MQMYDFITDVAKVSHDLGERVAHSLGGFAGTGPSVSDRVRAEDLVAERQAVGDVRRRCATARRRPEERHSENTKHVHLRVAVDARHAVLARAAHLGVRPCSHDVRSNNCPTPNDRQVHQLRRPLPPVQFEEKTCSTIR